MENGTIRRNLYFWGRVALLALAVALALGLCAARAEIVDSGTCGISLTWTLDDEGTLTISGTGKMYDFSQSYLSPWGTSINNIIIESGVTSIGKRAFFECSSLTSVKIPNSVTNIDNYAFYKCSSLIDIIIPDSVITIGDAVFFNCSSLNSIIIPENVSAISDSLFSGCINLNSVTIPENITRIGSHAFYGCKYISSINIPDGVTSVGDGAFYDCSSLTTIRIPNGVTSIGNSTFYGCNNLNSISLPETISSIGLYAFEYCQNLSSIKIPEKVKTIECFTFAYCSSLHSITIPNSVTAIYSDAFDECKSLTKVYIPTSTTYFGQYPFTIFKGTIYCHEFSEADYWATGKGYNVVYVDNIDIESIRTLTLPRDFRLACGETRKLVVDVFPNYDHPVVTWASSAPEIASVEDGLVTAIAPGSAVITASLGDNTASVTVETFAPLQDFDVPAEVWVVAKKTLQLVPENITPEGASGDFTWAMADADIATVDETGLVSGRKPGDTTLTVTEVGTGIVRTTEVHVCYPVDAISLDPETASLIQGQSFQLTANVTARTQTFVNKLVTFSSSDETVATVDQNGVVTAIGMGTATITAVSDDGVSATCEMTVREPIVTTLPAELTAIEEEAFMGDLSLESVVIPNGCQSIGPRAFAGCANLVYVRIPAGTDVASDAFEGCDNVVIEYME